MNTKRLLSLLVPFMLVSSSVSAQLDEYGVPVPELAVFDTIMQDFMAEHGISAGVLGVMNNGTIVYQRGFGISENGLMRIASVEKSLTAAAIKILAGWGAISLGDTNEATKVFDLGQAEGGILRLAPWDGLGDARLNDVTVQHLLDHKGGWEGRPGSIEIAEKMGVPSPPSRDQVASYMLSQPLQFQPGTSFSYSNFGYVLLGQIVEEVTGVSHRDFIRTYVLTPDQWVPSTEILFGRSRAPSSREPVYQSADSCWNVFARSTRVSCPYGGWHHEWFVGAGNLVMSAAPLLRYLDQYVLTTGMPYDSAPPAGILVFAGGLPGTNTSATQRGDGVHVVVLYNRSGPSGFHYAIETTWLIYAAINAGITWPTESVEGAWVSFSPTGLSGHGAYDNPLGTMDSVLAETTDGTKLRIMPGSSGAWSGTISTKMLIDAPFGTAVIGQ